MKTTTKCMMAFIMLAMASMLVIPAFARHQEYSQFTKAEQVGVIHGDWQHFFRVWGDPAYGRGFFYNNFAPRTGEDFGKFGMNLEIDASNGFRGDGNFIEVGMGDTTFEEGWQLRFIFNANNDNALVRLRAMWQNPYAWMDQETVDMSEYTVWFRVRITKSPTEHPLGGYTGYYAVDVMKIRISDSLGFPMFSDCLGGTTTVDPEDEVWQTRYEFYDDLLTHEFDVFAELIETDVPQDNNQDGWCELTDLMRCGSSIGKNIAQYGIQMWYFSDLPYWCIDTNSDRYVELTDMFYYSNNFNWHF